MGWLVIVLPDEAPRQFRLGKLDAGFGRARTNAVPIADTKCSSFHCVVRPSGGKFVLEDTGSRNGTFINGEKLDGTHPLVEGDEVIIGQTRMTYTETAPDASIEKLHNPDHHPESAVLQSVPDSVLEVEPGSDTSDLRGSSSGASETSAGPIETVDLRADAAAAGMEAAASGDPAGSGTDRAPATDARPTPPPAEPVPQTPPLNQPLPSRIDPPTESLPIPPPATLADARALADETASSGDSTSIPLPTTGSRRSETTVRVAAGADQTENISLRELSDLVTASRRSIPVVAPRPANRWVIALSGAAVVAFLLGMAMVLAVQAALQGRAGGGGGGERAASDTGAITTALSNQLLVIDDRLDRLESDLKDEMRETTGVQRSELNRLQDDLTTLADTHKRLTDATRETLERVVRLNDWLESIESRFATAEGAAELSAELSRLRAAVTDLRGQLATLLAEDGHQLVDNSAPIEPANANEPGSNSNNR